MKNQPPINLQLPQPTGPFEPNSRPGLADSARPGGNCPECGKGRLDYNGLLELECPACGFRSGGGEGCT